MQTLVDHHCHLVHDALSNWKPVEFTQDRSDMVTLPGMYVCMWIYIAQPLQPKQSRGASIG